jgi:branched-chain amino acid transport system ATP-binding protein
VSPPAILEIQDVHKRFGGLRALDGVTFDVRRGELLGLIGPNGAGKTTLFNVATGVHRADRGHVRFEGHEIGGQEPHRICRLGVGRTFQAVRPFLDMTVRQNVLVGAHFGHGAGTRPDEQRLADEILDLLDLRSKADVHPRQLTLVDRKIVELARTLATRPTLLLLDEILSGLNPTEMVRATTLIRRMRDEMGVTIVWIEHVMRALMTTCERVVVLNFGRVLAHGAPAAVAADPEVIRAYLGEKRVKSSG